MKKSVAKETDTIVSLARTRTPDEMKEYLYQRFMEDMGIFNRLVMERRQAHDWLRKQLPIIPLLKKVKELYADLESDGYLKKDMSLFEHDRIRRWITSQSRKEYADIMKGLHNKKGLRYDEVFRKWVRAYTINYESMISQYLVELALKISGKRISNNAKVLGTLKSYRQGKYSDLFKSLIPHVRNSIQHQDFIIDPKQPKITFYDRRKQPMSFTLEEYSQVVYESFFLTQSFDIADFDLRKNILDILLDAVNVVNGYIKKRRLKLSPREEGGLSILDLALLIKTGKIS